MPYTPVDNPYHVSASHGFMFSRTWTGGTHHYCVSATSSVDSRASASLGCVTWKQP